MPDWKRKNELKQKLLTGDARGGGGAAPPPEASAAGPSARRARARGFPRASGDGRSAVAAAAAKARRWKRRWRMTSPTRDLFLKVRTTFRL